ncbi:putative phage abortive infection protein [Dyadobacter sp. CY351]|uniref:putative phage abortive infection protein n=1 Tax=Dyadobacter sp. CY351 TaxID=2909337 RepID=UPI001F3EE6C6|nr:putative phage abortive infection protein [Dyadobacter sp. CY351]MCF2521080.1 putative phage abortive infection protein [Dyadobacter sp. CY351]
MMPDLNQKSKPSFKDKILREFIRMSWMEIAAWIIIVIGNIVIVGYLIDMYADGFWLFAKTDVEYEITGQFGDFIGGVVGTVFALGGTLMIIMSFKEQTEQNRTDRFEATFFEMIKLHKENVSEMNYTKFDPNTIYKDSCGRPKRGDMWQSNHKKVFRILIDEFKLCYNECKLFIGSDLMNEFVNQTHRDFLMGLVKERNVNIDVNELVMIDVAYSIFFYGLNSEGKDLLEYSFSMKYNEPSYKKLIAFLSQKPKREDEDNWKIWMEIIGNQGESDDDTSKTELIINVAVLSSRIETKTKFAKYYGGQQHRLGHYFRHLYQSFSYLYDQNWMDWDRRYFYGKMLRAQMSTYEQSLLFLNSLASIGRKWEINSDLISGQQKRRNLITSFHLIKNLPGLGIEGITYKKYYPLVAYESNEKEGDFPAA